ncbi:MAG TPA: HD domain-containing phosphohydrolase [Gaiellaceae bacterium]|nr:HD domain-containing phosphohydrolase [Gaiellaceae bacterium]
MTAAAIAGTLIYAGFGVGGSPLAIATLALISAVIEQSRVRLTATIEISISLLPTLFAAVAFGPLAGMIVAGASMLGDFRHDRLKWAVYTPSEAITGGLAGLVAALVLNHATDGFGATVAATIAALLAAQLCDFGFCSLTLMLRGAPGRGQIASMVTPLLVGAVPLYVPVVAVLVFAYSAVSPWTLPLFLAPTLAAQRLFVLYQRQRTLAVELGEANETLERANLSFATALVATLDARDQYTAGHSAAVAVYARDIARQMGLPERDRELAHLCGLVHDIGKIGLPPGLLEKEGPLTLEERRRMEEHAAIGERILANVEGYEPIATAVRHHHERVDGNGYPDQLAGSDIPLIARIVAVADAYDAMISQRPYRDAMPSAVARLRLANAVGKQFDISVVAAFEAILSVADEEYLLGTHMRPTRVPAPSAPLAIAATS